MLASIWVTTNIPAIIESRPRHPLIEVDTHDRATSVATEPYRHPRIPVCRKHYYINKTRAYHIIQVSTLSDLEQATVMLNEMNKMRVLDLWSTAHATKTSVRRLSTTLYLQTMFANKENRKSLCVVSSYLQPATSSSILVWIVNMEPICATKCQYLSSDRLISADSVIRSVSHYPRSTWMKSLISSENGSITNLVSGWYIVTAVMNAIMEGLGTHLNGPRTRAWKGTAEF